MTSRRCTLSEITLWVRGKTQLIRTFYSRCAVTSSDNFVLRFPRKTLVFGAHLKSVKIIKRGRASKLRIKTKVTIKMKKKSLSYLLPFFRKKKLFSLKMMQNKIYCNGAVCATQCNLEHSNLMTTFHTFSEVHNKVFRYIFYWYNTKYL